MSKKNPHRAVNNVKIILGLSHSEQLGKLVQQQYAEVVF